MTPVEDAKNYTRQTLGALQEIDAEISDLRTKLAAANEVIGFYADKDNWRARGHPQIDADTVPVTQDGGSRARAFLNKENADCGGAK